MHILAVAALLGTVGCQTLDSRATLKPTFDTPAFDKAGPTVLPAGGREVDGTSNGGGIPASTAANSAARSPKVDVGSGNVIKQPASAPVMAAGDGEVILNFIDAEIEEVARAILADALGRNYIIDPTVGGTVTLHTSRPMALEELPALLESVLQINGAALVTDGDFYRIVPTANAASSGLSPSLRMPAEAAGLNRAVTSGYGLYVVPLRHIAVGELEILLEPFLPAGSVAKVDQTRNLLLLSGPPEQVSTVLDLVDMFDVDWLAGMSIGLYPLLVADPEALAGELQAIFAGDNPQSLDGILRFVPIPRLQAVMAITPQSRYLARVERWIDRLDKGVEGDGKGVYIYSVQFGSAVNLADVLRELFDADGRTIAAPDLKPALAPGLEPLTLSRPGERAEQGGTVTANIPSPIRPASRRRESAKPVNPQGEAIRIAADEVTNSLVIQATPQDYRRIRQALDELDVMPLQVLIEVTIAEVSLRDQLRYGLQWFFRFGGIDARLSETDSGAPAQNFPGFAAVFSSGNDVRVVLNALDSLTDINVLSSPQLLVLDNQQARLQVGDEVPVAVQQSRSTDDPNAPIVNTIEQRDTGVILEITPRVNTSGLTLLQIDQQVSRVTSTTTSGIDSPTINQRRLTSTVAVHSGETVALGGLIQESANDTQAGVPILSRLPLVGPLFGTKTNDVQRTELLVLLTPRVLYNRDDARQVTDDLRQRLHQLQPFAQEPSAEVDVTSE